jgi:hypothetical protein
MAGRKAGVLVELHIYEHGVSQAENDFRAALEVIDLVRETMNFSMRCLRAQSKMR